MVKTTFNFELKTLLEQFLAAFNDIVIFNYDKNKNKVDPLNGIKVKFYYAPKTRVFAALQKPNFGGFQLPAVAVSITGIQRDPNRIFNKIQGFNIDTTAPNIPSPLLKPILSPIPVNIGIEMLIMTQYQNDMDQILTNFMPYCDPYIVISWVMPDSKGTENQYEIRSEVTWSNNIAMQYPMDINGGTSYRIVANTNFTIKGWMFKQFNEFARRIFTIDSDYTPITLEDSIFEFNDDTEYFSVSARPFINTLDPYEIYVNSTNPLSSNISPISLYGNNFSYVYNVYLSSSNNGLLPNTSYYSPFSSISSLSAYYPGFSGYLLSEFVLTSDNYIQFELPQTPLQSGFIDIILENEAGYGKLTLDTQKPYRNPYPVENPLHNDYLQYQPPSISGIQIHYV